DDPGDRGSVRRGRQDHAAADGQRRGAGAGPADPAGFGACRVGLIGPGRNTARANRPAGRPHPRDVQPGGNVFVRHMSEVEDTEDDIKTENWRSKRIVLAREKVGFSVHETTLYAGTVNDFWYDNHVEAVFVTHGEGEVEDKATGEVHQLAPGSLY